MEVMVAVLIVSVVIASIFSLKGNANKKLLWVKESIHENQYNSFLLGVSDKYGFETSNISLNELADDFELESDLRRELKGIKVKLSYEKKDAFETPVGAVFEIGRTKLESQKFDLSMLRVRLQ